ncbi:MAG: histidine phosphatase family protein [Patescibacteria group bacterium]
MKYIYLMRHGQVDNPKGLVYGNEPGFPLTEKGRSMAHAAAKHFKTQEICPDKIYSSPNARALETADILAKDLELGVEIENTIVDWKMGKWVGGTTKNFVKNSGYYDKPIKMDDLEPFDEAADRMINFFQKILSDMYEGEAVLVVSHRENSAAALLKLQDQNYEYIHDVRLPVGSVWLLKFGDDGKFISAEFKWGGVDEQATING